MRLVSLAMLITMMGIGLIALLSPGIAHGAIAIKAINPLRGNLLADTIHKPVAKKSEHLARTHAYKKPSQLTSKDNYSPEEKLQELSAEVERNSAKLNKYYNSGAFKTTQHDLEQKGREISEFYNKPELKSLQEELGKVSGDFSKKYSNNEETQQLSAKMGELGRSVSAYFYTPEFKKMNEALEDKYGIPRHREYNDDYYKDENYKKYQAELESKLPPEIKRQTAELNKMGEQMTAHYESPEAKQLQQRMQELGDSLNKAYENPSIKQQQMEMDKLSGQMNSYQNNPELKRANEQLQRSVARMNAYMNSPEYQHYLRNLEKMSFNDEKPGLDN